MAATQRAASGEASFQFRIGPQAHGLAGWIRRHATLAFVLGSYAWAWLIWAYWVPTMSASGIEMSPGFLAAALIGGLAPSLVALLVTAVVRGRTEVKRLLRRALDWRAPIRFYAIALLLVPAVTVISLWAQSRGLVDLDWSDWSGLIPLAIGWPIMAAIGEEFGWRGFALPRLQARYGAVVAAVVVGLIWGFWHLPADYIGLKGLGWWFVMAFAVGGPLVLTAHSIIMTWIYNRTGGKFPLMLLYHFSITSSAILTPVIVGSDALKVLSPLITALVLWVIAGALLLFRRADFPAASPARLEFTATLRL